MTHDVPAPACDMFGKHSSFERCDKGFTVTTTSFEGLVTASTADGSSLTYTVTVRVPTLDAATADDIGDAVEADWLRTLRRRLEDAPGATRRAVSLDSFAAERYDDEIRVEYVFTWGDPASGADIAATFVEFVEGTYVEGIVPGYEYEPPVADLLARATQDGSSGTPL